MAAEPAYRVKLSRSAQADLARICSHLADSHSAELADRWLLDFLERIDSLEHYPERGSIPKEMQSLGVNRYRQLLLHPYRIFYRVIGAEVVVTLIADGRRDMVSLLQQRLLG
jgi:toxin ParE1/3/4